VSHWHLATRLAASTWDAGGLGQAFTLSLYLTPAEGQVLVCALDLAG
jgi:hypothetical protein